MAKKETHTSDNAKLYELGIHILPTIAEDKVTDAFSSVTGIISKNNGSIVKTGEPKAIKLAYMITKKIDTQNVRFKTAYFGWIKFETTSEDVENIKLEVKADKDILRYILIKTVDDDEHSTIKLVNEEDAEEGLEDAHESEMDSEEVIDSSPTAAMDEDADNDASIDTDNDTDKDTADVIKKSSKNEKETESDEKDAKKANATKPESIKKEEVQEPKVKVEKKKETKPKPEEAKKNKKDLDQIDEVLDELSK